MTRTLLIDADVVAYQAATSREVAIEWEPGYWTWHCSMSQVQAAIDQEVANLVEKLDADDYKLCLTDSEGNFRFRVLPSYKGNRTSKKPLVLKAVKEWLIEERGAYFRPGLEGDDCMGILATAPHIKGEKVIVSIDKDMKTIPGLYYRDAETGVVEVSQEEADFWHLYQTLTGDTTDGYAGCPGVGPDAATKHLKDLIKVEPYEHELKSGPRKGQVDTRWRNVEADNAWEVVVSLYQKAGLSERDALQQARVARILRASDYDFKKKEPILWSPKPQP